MQLINAAGEAGVPWILPNDWGHDTANEAFVQDVAYFKPKGDDSPKCQAMLMTEFVRTVAVGKATEGLGKS